MCSTPPFYATRLAFFLHKPIKIQHKYTEVKYAIQNNDKYIKNFNLLTTRLQYKIKIDKSNTGSYKRFNHFQKILQ